MWLRSELTDTELDRIGSGRVVVRERVVEPARTARWLAELRAADAAGELCPAGVGAAGHLVPEVRADRTAFVRGDDPRWTELVAGFSALAAPLAAGLRLALPAMSVQLAVFPPGARYDEHVDAIRGDPFRRVTAVLYLDDLWTAEDGGAIRVVEPEGPREVLPVGGRLVLFRSDAVAHAVLPPRRPRGAAAAWYGARGSLPTSAG